MTAMSRGSPSSAVCRARSFMTTPGLRWPASSVTASVSGHVCSASYDPITCSRTALAAPARGTTRARSRGSSAIAAGTSWCRCQGSGTSMISTRILKACCAKRWAEQLRGHDQTVGERLERDRAVLQRLPAIAYDACDKRPGAGQFAVAGALSRHRLLRPHTVRPLRGAGPRLCPRGGHQLRRRGDCQATRVHTSKRTSSSIRCTICPCWSKRPTRWIRRLPWPAGCCRRCSAISAAYLKRGWAKPGSGNTSRCCG